LYHAGRRPHNAGCLTVSGKIRFNRILPETAPRVNTPHHAATEINFHRAIPTSVILSAAKDLSFQ
jgi:hypothetical protein